MYLGSLLVVLTALPSGQPFSIPSTGNQPLVVQPGDEAAVKTAGLPTSGPGLLDFFRKRSAPSASPDLVAALIKQLNDPKPEQREKAAAELIGHGPHAVPLLREASNNAEDRDGAAQAQHCLLAIEGPNSAALTQSQVRLLAAQRQAGSVEVLVGFLPFAENEQVVGQVQSALVTMAALVDGKMDEVLRRALADPIPVRRAVAASVLARVGGASSFPTIRPLLKDPKPSVRLKVGLALIENQDAEAVSFLIDLLPELPGPQQKEVEDLLTGLAGDWAVTTPRGQDPLARQLKRELWQTWWRHTEGPTLLKEFGDRCLPEEELPQVLALVQKLDAEAAEDRDKAGEALLARGARIVPLLRLAAAHSSKQQQACLTKCLAVLEKDALPPLPSTAPRLLALRRPEGALAMLLAYLPYADNLETQTHVGALIGQVGWREGKADPLVLKALQDPVSIRRSTAASLLIRQGDPQQQADARKLLHDPDAGVRLKVATTLTGAGDKEGVPVLIALLAELPFEQGWEVEEYLATMAGEKAPSMTLQSDAEGRKRCRDAWAQWWRENSGKVELARDGQEQPNMGLWLLIEHFNPTTRLGSVSERDRAGKTRWKIDNLMVPLDAQVLPGQRVLIAEQNTSKVTERDLTGKILWEKVVAQPIHCRRLRNGNTFIAGRNGLFEVDSRGKDVLSHPVLNDTILAAQRFRDGQIAFLTFQGNYHRLDSTGKEVKAFRIPINPGVGINGADVLPGDRVVVSMYAANKVIEYDAEGRTVWEASVSTPQNLTRLPSGNTLVVVAAGTNFVELDRAGKIVHEGKDLTVHPWRVYRR
jgi:HEAT repeat protein